MYPTAPVCLPARGFIDFCRCVVMLPCWLVLVVVPVSTGAANAAQTAISGPVHVQSATRMTIGRTPVRLAHIRSVKAGSPCTWKGRQLDCGVLATAGLKDLVVAAKVVCWPATRGAFVCRADGYDVGYGLVHAGWAVPLADAPPSYRAKARNAQKRHVGLWAARTQNGKAVAKSLTTPRGPAPVR